MADPLNLEPTAENIDLQKYELLKTFDYPIDFMDELEQAPIDFYSDELKPALISIYLKQALKVQGKSLYLGNLPISSETEADLYLKQFMYVPVTYASIPGKIKHRGRPKKYDSQGECFNTNLKSVSTMHNLI